MNNLPDGSAVIIIPHISVQDIQLVSGMHVMGAPEPTALVGLMHNLARRSGLLSHITGIAMMSHSLSMQAGYARNPGGPGGIAPVLDSPKGIMTCSLLLSTRNMFEDGNPNEAAYAIRSALRGMRLAGGTIWSDKNRRVSAYCDVASLRAAFFSLPQGTVFRDRMDMMPENEPDVDALEAFMNILSFPRRGSKGWLVPTMVGYRAISASRAIAGLRCNAPEHQWVEEVLGIGQWISQRHAWREDFSRCFWKFDQEESEAGIHIVSAA